MTLLRTEADARAWLAGCVGDAPRAMAQFEQLIALLVEENGRQNLVSATSLDQVWLRHIADSAQLLGHVPRGTVSTWLDLGTGAGFPGLVISILRPDIEVTLVESRGRRIAWLQHCIAALGLPRTRVEGARLEAIATRPVDVISARAFAPLARLLELSARFSTSDTLWLLPKGRSARDEVAQLDGWSHLFHVEQSLTDDDAGVIVGRVIGRSPATTGRTG